MRLSQGMPVVVVTDTEGQGGHRIAAMGGEQNAHVISTKDEYRHQE